jgi:hypothetical protein
MAENLLLALQQQKHEQEGEAQEEGNRRQLRRLQRLQRRRQSLMASIEYCCNQHQQPNNNNNNNTTTSNNVDFELSLLWDKLWPDERHNDTAVYMFLAHCHGTLFGVNPWSCRHVYTAVVKYYHANIIPILLLLLVTMIITLPRDLYLPLYKTTTTTTTVTTVTAGPLLLQQHVFKFLRVCETIKKVMMAVCGTTSSWACFPQASTRLRK